METRTFVSRQIWKLDDADWPVISSYIAEFDWQRLRQGSIDDALSLFLSVIEEQMQKHIPPISKSVEKSCLPWLTDKCRSAIHAKHNAEGTETYTQMCSESATVLHAEKQKYLEQLKKKMSNLPKSSKQWWAINKRLLHKQAAPPLFPPLRTGADVWCKTPAAKANAFAQCWTAKCKLPAEVFEHFLCAVSDEMPAWFPIRERDVRRFLQKLRLDQATGPDGLSAKLLHMLSDVIALPLAILTRRIFQEGQWPARWRLHHICPLFKRGSVYLPDQYRGIRFFRKLWRG